MAKEFFVPNKIIMGEGAVGSLSAYVKDFGKKALIISGKTVSTLPCYKALTDALDSAGIEHELFNEITGEPDDKMINAGLARFKASGSDFLIGIGGGSPIDSMKAIAVLASCGGKIADYMGKEISGVLPKMVAIPTTAGTGSEVTQFTVITDSETQIKMLLKGRCLLPDVALVDGENTLSSPPTVTASTGLDALTHAVEAYTSKKAQPLTDALAVSAVKRIFKYLPRAYKDGTDKKAREEMAYAALEAGICINNSSVTIVHGMSRPIGALFHVPHGMSNAMLLPSCMGFAVDGAYEKFADLARAIGAADADTPDKKAAKHFIKALKGICDTCDIPSLKKYGIDKDEFLSKIDKMSDDALASGSPGNTVKEVTKEDVLEIYKSLF